MQWCTCTSICQKMTGCLDCLKAGARCKQRVTDLCEKEGHCQAESSRRICFLLQLAGKSFAVVLQRTAVPAWTVYCTRNTTSYRHAMLSELQGDRQQQLAEQVRMGHGLPSEADGQYEACMAEA